MVRRLSFRDAALLIASTTLAGCRSDSLTSSEPVLCADRPGCVTEATVVTSQSVIISALDDASTRIAPALMDARTREQIGPALGTLRGDLLAGRFEIGRQSLAVAYAALQTAESRPLGAGDIADLAAIRLSLVPAADALGVAAR